MLSKYKAPGTLILEVSAPGNAGVPDWPACDRPRPKTGVPVHLTPSRRHKGNPMAIISYAQNYEEVLLNRLFPESHTGFYARRRRHSHPVIHSVTQLFYKRGWHGINIEPIPSISELLAHDRQRDINLPLPQAIGP